MPTQPQCDALRFNRSEQGGLQAITKAGDANRFKKFYRQFVNLLSRKSDDPAKQPSAPVIQTIFELNGFYLGKEQLKCILDQDFADYAGIRISFGLNQDTAKARTQTSLVLVIQGAFPTEEQELGTVKKKNVVVDRRFHKLSDLAYMAGSMPEDGSPGPGSRQSPPY